MKKTNWLDENIHLSNLRENGWLKKSDSIYIMLSKLDLELVVNEVIEALNELTFDEKVDPQQEGLMVSWTNYCSDFDAIDDILSMAMEHKKEINFERILIEMLKMKRDTKINTIIGDTK